MANLNDVFNKDSPSFADELDNVSTEVDVFLYELECLVDEEHVQYARDTIEGIMETVKKTNQITDGQRRAIKNIDRGGLRGQRRRY